MSQNLCVVQAASGLLGCHVVKDLLDNGYSVRALVRAGSSQEKLSMLQNLKKQHQNLEIMQLGDLSDQNLFDNAYRDARFAVFSASPYRIDVSDTEKYHNDIMMSLRNSFRSIQKHQNNIKKVVYVSSVASLIDMEACIAQKGQQVRPVNTNDRNTNANLKRDQPYDFMQLEALNEVKKQCQSLSVPLVVIFAGFPVGPMLETTRRSGNVVDWASLYFRDTFDSKKQRTYCYSNVQDVAMAIRHILGNDKFKTGQDFIVAEECPTHPIKVYETIRNYKADMVKFKPSDQDRQRCMDEAKRLKGVKTLDISRTEKELGLKPQDSEKSMAVMMKTLIDQKIITTPSA